MYSVFANMEIGWINMATVIGAVVGTGISVYAIWFSNKLNHESSEISVAIKANTEAIQKQTAAIHAHTKILRLDSLRNLYELSRGDERRHSFWHFRWRFETYDRIGATIYDSVDNQEIYLGGCDLYIEGFSNRADQVGLEHRESDFYSAKIKNPVAAEGQQFPFQENQTVACYDREGQLVISKGVDPWSTAPSYRMNISGMGRHRTFSGERNVDSLSNFPRIKD